MILFFHTFQTQYFPIHAYTFIKILLIAICRVDCFLLYSIIILKLHILHIQNEKISKDVQLRLMLSPLL